MIWCQNFISVKITIFEIQSRLLQGPNIKAGNYHIINRYIYMKNIYWNNSSNNEISNRHYVWYYTDISEVESISWDVALERSYSFCAIGYFQICKDLFDLSCEQFLKLIQRLVFDSVQGEFFSAWIQLEFYPFLPMSYFRMIHKLRRWKCR